MQSQQLEEEQNIDFTYQGVLEGHSDWVTSIVAGYPQKENEDSQVLVSGSRDKSLMVWKLFEEEQDGHFGVPYRQLTGHNHFVSDLALSQENCFVISSSWDKTLRLWDLRQGKSVKQFVGHNKEVFTCAFSPDCRQILSAGADKTIKLWNTLADCKFDSEGSNHTDWISSIRYSPVLKQSKTQPFPNYFASVGWDGRLKIWNTNISIKYTFKAHEGNVNTVSISPNGKYIATGGKDKKLNIWDIMDLEHVSREFDCGSSINNVAFNPKMQWLAAGTENNIKIYNLRSTKTAPIISLTPEPPFKKGKGKAPFCTSLTWNSLGKKLFAGFSDGLIRVWQANSEEK